MSSASLYATTAASEGNDSMDCRTLALHQYVQWKEWSQSGSRRRSRQSLMDDRVDPAAERHMYIPANHVAATRTPSNLDNDEMVGRVAAFFQTIQNNHLLQQLQRADGIYEPQHYYQHNDYAYTPAATVHSHHNNTYCLQDDSLTSTTAAEDASALTELGFTPSFIRNQEEMWRRTTQQQQEVEAYMGPIIPDWLHAAALNSGRKIKVVAINSWTDTRIIACVGCQKQMLAASHVEIVFCPDCGCTFAPEILNSAENGK
jgi:hypothetical protein